MHVVIFVSKLYIFIIYLYYRPFLLQTGNTSERPFRRLIEAFVLDLYCSASEVRHPSEVCHLRFMTILKSFYCPVMAYMYTLPLKEDTVPFI